MVDKSTGRMEAVPLRSMDKATCVDALEGKWVARFGVSSTLTLDQGRQFTSTVWASMCRLLGMQHVNTTTYHPQSNSMVERTQRHPKYALRARLAGAR